MANSGRIIYGPLTKAGITDIYIYIDWVSKSVVSTNSSILTLSISIGSTDTKTYRLSGYVPTGIGFNVPSSDYWVNVNGVKYTYSPSHSSINKTTSGTPSSTSLKIATITTQPIVHNSDGSKTVNIDYSIPYYVKNLSTLEDIASGYGGGRSIDLGTISPAAKITSAPNFTDEDNPTIKYSNPLGNQASSILIGIAGSKDEWIIPPEEVNAIGSSYTFNFTDAKRNRLREYAKFSVSTPIRFCIQTIYNGKTYNSFVSRTLTIIKANPIITASVKDINPTTIALTGDENTLILHHSIAEVIMNAEGQKGAVIDLDSIVIKNGGSNVAFSSPAVFNPYTSPKIEIFVQDSRRAASEMELIPNVHFEYISYIQPTCNIERSELEATGGMLIDVEGNYFNGSFGAVNNTLNVECRYKTQNSEYSDWIPMEVYLHQNTYSASITIEDLNYREKYFIQCRCYDKLETIETQEITVKSFPVFHWSENDFVFEVPVIFNAGVEGAEITPGEGEGGSSSGLIDGNATITGDCVINGNLRLKGAGNYGNTIYFGDGSYAMISEPTDDALTIKATKLNLEGLVSLNGGVVDSGSWIPKLNNSSAVSSYSVQQGWYQRIGKVITIGWQLKATINSGYSSSSLSITGTPFTPLYAAFGGGVAHNINVSAGFNFEGWTIDTSGNISPRTQPCNGTSAGNLQISSTAYYPSGSGNVLTLAGTICYVAN